LEHHRASVAWHALLMIVHTREVGRANDRKRCTGQLCRSRDGFAVPRDTLFLADSVAGFLIGRANKGRLRTLAHVDRRTQAADATDTAWSSTSRDYDR
jgi:hypothetical protein